MKTRAVLSLFTVAPALLVPAIVRAQQLDPPPQQLVAQPEPYQPPDPSQPPRPYQPPDPNQQSDPYQQPDPYETAADPSQIDWPQDVAPEEAAVDGYDDGYDPQAYTQFQDELSPYGDWIDDGSYGRVWMPTSSLVGADFTPYYSGGHWALTEFGWTWVSDWSWGWAPFHYGRWIIVAGHGWCWVPGTMWGPAWVTWRSGGGYVGWAALPPRGVSVTVTYGSRSPWRFTRAGDLGAPRPRCLPMRDTRGMFHRTTLVANDRVLTRGAATVHINAGPRYIPNATPVRLRAVAPQAFPQRAILPRAGAPMYARPWIRAAAAGRAPAGGDSRPATVIGGGRGRAGNSPAGGSSSPAPHIYNAPRPVAPTMQASSGPHIYDAPRVYDRPAASNPPRVYDRPVASNPPHVYNPSQTYGAPRAFGAAPAHDLGRSYNPTPRLPVTTPQAPSSPRAFAPPPARIYNSPAPRAFAPPPAQRPTAQPFHQAFTPPQMHAPPPRTFSAPASGGFGNAGGGGGMHFGGGHRR